jgi:hypothetical protein
MSDCAQWIEIFERQETGEVVSLHEQRFFDEHLVHCARCQAERQALASLQLRPMLASTANDDAVIDSVLRADADNTTPSPRWQRRALFLGLATAAVALVVVFWRPQPAAPTFEIAQLSGEAMLDGLPAVVGQALEPRATLRVLRGRTCVRVAKCGTFCLSESSVSSARDVDGPERTLHLVTGTVKVTISKQPPGTRCGVHTDDGDALAVGTVFEVSRRERTRVEVSEGTVLTRHAGHEKLVDAGNAVTFGAPAPAEPPLDLEPPLGLPPPPVGRTDLPEAVTPSIQRRPRPMVKAAPSVNPPSSHASAAELLRSARGLKSDGLNSEAARTYEQLMELYPNTPEALAGLLALSDLELASLGRPERALAHARQYLAANGPLREDALLRQIRALKALGRETDARNAIDAFGREFPDSPYLENLRR